LRADLVAHNDEEKKYVMIAMMADRIQAYRLRRR
jgi:hypothetical protein